MFSTSSATPSVGPNPFLRSPYVFKPENVQASHHRGLDWVERRKHKRIVVEELVAIKSNLKYLLLADGSINGSEWRV